MLRQPWRSALIQVRLSRRPIPLLALLLLAVSPARAWKPASHVYFSEIAYRDALDDGKVTIYAVDYAGGAVKRDGSGSPVRIGDYAVNPSILAAIRAYPDRYRAGAFGPDAYPDILTGQQMIHPAGQVTPGENADDLNPGGTGPGPWLQHLWDVAYGSKGTAADRSLQARAFVVGYLTHAAGDTYIHTFINRYAGGAFHFVENAAKHIVLEGYMVKRLPPLASWDATIDDLEGWIYRNMVYAPPGSALASLYTGENKRLSVPAVFSALRNELQRQIDAYASTLADYDRRIKDKLAAADACALTDFTCSKAILYDQATAIRNEKLGYITRNSPFNTYKKHWRDDIDDGLKAWPRLSHELARAIFFNAPAPGERYGKVDIERARKLINDYSLLHLSSMAGAPDFVGLTTWQVGQIVGTVIDSLKMPILSEAIKAIQRDMFDFLFRHTFGVSPEELKEYLESPERRFDPVLNNPAYNSAGGTLVSMADFNHRELLLADNAFSNPDNPETLDWRRFRPAYNTVLLSKLLLLGPDEINRLFRDLRSPTVFRGTNLMLGFSETLDGSNQWHANPDKMALAIRCEDYEQVFMKQAGEGACGKGSLSIDPASVTLIGGSSASFTITPADPVRWELIDRVQGDRFETLSDHVGRYTAPPVVKGVPQITVKARADDDTDREATARVTLDDKGGLTGGVTIGLGSEGGNYTWTGAGDGELWTDKCNWFPKGSDCKAYPGEDPENKGIEDVANIPREGTSANIRLTKPIRLKSLVMRKGAFLSGEKITIKKTFAWEGGAVYNTIHILPGARTQIGSDVLKISLGTKDAVMEPEEIFLLDGSFGAGRIVNEGDLVWSSGNLRLGRNAVIDNKGRFFTKVAKARIAGDCCISRNLIVNTGEFVVAAAPVFGATLPGNLEIPIGDTGRTIALGGLTSPDVTIGVTKPGSVAFEGVGLDHRGRVTVQEGNTLALDYGLHVFANGTRFAGKGRTVVVGSAVTFNGTTDLAEGTVFELTKGGEIKGRGGFSGTGRFHWTGGTLYADFTISSATTMVIDGADEKQINASFDGGILHNEGTVTWNGSGGRLRMYRVASFVNRGVVVIRGRANVIGDCCVATDVFRNDGTFVVTSSLPVPPLTPGSLPAAPGDVVFHGASWFGNGILEVREGSLTLESGHHVLNDNSRLSGSGRVRITDDATFLNGKVTIDRGATLELASDGGQGGVLDGEGSLTGGGAFAWSGGAIRGSVTLAPGFEARIEGDNERRIVSPDGRTGGRLMNRGHIAWTGKGKLLLASPFGITNAKEGRIDASEAAIVGARSCCTDPYTLVNEGTFTQTAGSTTFDSAFLQNTGTLDLAGSLIFTTGGVSSLSQSSGVTRLSGGGIRTAGVFAVISGILTGSGTVAGKVVNAGSVEPGNPIGTLSITGDYEQKPSGSLLIDVGATGDADRLDVGGKAALGGTLKAALAAGFRPDGATRLRVMTWKTRTGDFATTEGLMTAGGVTLDPALDSTGLSLVPAAGGTAAAMPGDLNGDGRVTTADATLALRIAIGSLTATPEQMDRGDVAPKPGAGSKAGQPYGDGRITTADVTRIMRRSMGQETVWP